MITLSAFAGFCFGVRRATDNAEALISQKGENTLICTLGKLIHNEQYSEHLAKNGVKEVTSKYIEAIYEKAKNVTLVTLITRTHGIEKETQKTLEAYAKACSNFKIVDSTCPYVKKIHKIAKEESGKGSVIFVIGQKDHPEVLSIKSYIEGEDHIFASADELENHLKSGNYTEKSVVMVAQTTQKLSECKMSRFVEFCG